MKEFHVNKFMNSLRWTANSPRSKRPLAVNFQSHFKIRSSNISLWIIQNVNCEFKSFNAFGNAYDSDLSIDSPKIFDLLAVRKQLSSFLHMFQLELRKNVKIKRFRHFAINWKKSNYLSFHHISKINQRNSFMMHWITVSAFIMDCMSKL